MELWGPSVQALEGSYKDESGTSPRLIEMALQKEQGQMSLGS